nr:unnamed protein product [Spirometra erinaceieuropaei]
MFDSGVLQGSVLEPILFLIYVDDAARDLDCEVAMLADDMKIWDVIRGSADEDRLQMNLNRLEEWSNRWLLRFNVAKCSILRLGNTARSASTRGYFLGGAALPKVEAQRDLGVLTTSSLKPSAHCSRVAKSAMTVLYAIKHPSATPTLPLDAYENLIRAKISESSGSIMTLPYIPDDHPVCGRGMIQDMFDSELCISSYRPSAEATSVKSTRYRDVEYLQSTTTFAAYKDIQEGQLVVLFLLHRKLNVRENDGEMFLECQHLIPFDDDEGIIHIRGPELRSYGDGRPATLTVVGPSR